MSSSTRRFSAATDVLSVSLGVRPPRLGILVAVPKGVSWPHVFEIALAAQARVWGGQANIPFALTPDIFDSELFWALADRLDADTYVLQHLSVADIQLFDPKWFDDRRRHVERELADSNVTAAARETFWIEHLQSTEFATAISEADYRLLVNRLGMFDSEHSSSFDGFGTALEPGWPWGMDAAKFDELPPRVSNSVVTSRLGAARRLLMTTQVGRVGHGFHKALTERGVAIVDHEIKERSEWARELFNDDRTEVVAWILGERGLSWYRLGGRIEQLPATLVVGDSPWDFTLFYALRRWTSLAWWLPSWLRRDPLYLHHLASSMEWGARGSGGDVVVTTTSSPKQRDRTVKELRGLPGSGLNPDTADWRETLPAEPNRYFEYENTGVPTPTLLIGEEKPETPDLPTPLPQRVAASPELEMRWITEARVDDWSPTRSSTALGTKVLDAFGYEHGMVRTTRYGIGYFCPNWFTQSGQGLTSSTVRPRIRPLSAREQIEALLQPHGWTCELSDKGIYASETVRLFGNLEATCASLRDKAVRPLLDAFLVERGNAPGRYLSHDKRRYLTLHQAEAVVSSAPSVIPELVEKGILIRGILLKCERCRQEGWYGLPELTDVFVCRRCYRSQKVIGGQLAGSPEPVWTYRLAEVVRQFLASEGDLPLLVAWDRFGESRMPLAVAHELKISRPNGDDPREIDIAAAHGYELWIGEATTTGSIQPLNRINKLKQLARWLPAYGVILATSSPHFTRNVRERFENRFSSVWPQRALLTRVKRGP